MLYKLFFLVFLIGSPLSAYSQTFFEKNAEGIAVYYTVTSPEENTVEISRPSTPYSGMLTIPETVEHNGIRYRVTGIGEHAFNHIPVTEIHLPNSIRTIGKNAFYNCSTMETIALPGQITEIGESAFELCTALQTISFPESMETIGNRAFSRCSRLTSVSFPEKIRQIGEKAFTYCSNLQTLLFSEGITSIGREAFRGTSLASVTLPASVSSIGEGAFSHCLSLKEIVVHEHNRHFCAEQGILLNHSKELLHTWPAGNTDFSSFPQGVTQINAYAFYGNGLSSFTLPEGIRSIGEQAFGNNKLTFLSLPATLQVLASSAFLSYYPLYHVQCKAVAVPFTEGTTIPSFGSSSRTVVFEVPEASIPAYEKAWTYGKFVATGATDAKIVLNQAGTLNAHFDEEQLPILFSLELTGPLNGNDINVLQKLTNLVKLDLSNATITAGGDPYESQPEFGDKEKFFTQDNYIGEYLFSSLSSHLQEITLPLSVTSIGDGAFYGCGISSLAIPSGVTRIGRSAFRECTKLTAIRIPKNTELAGGSVFYGCSSLQEVVFEGSMPELPYQAFSNCTSLLKVVLPEGLQTLGMEAFLNCTRLSFLSFPKSIKKIESWCMDGCTSLTRIEVRNPIPCMLSSDSFYGLALNACTLYVPSVGVSGYQEAEYWNQFGTITALDEGPSSLGNEVRREQTDDFTVISRPGGFTLIAQKAQEIRIYNQYGNLLTRLFLSEKETHTLGHLPQGLYFINGKKAFVR